MGIETKFQIVTKGNNLEEVTEETLKVLSPANQLAAILADSVGITNPISSFTTKEGKVVKFVSEATCVAVLDAMKK